MGQQQSHKDAGAVPGGCALAGAWAPIRKGEWKARVLGTPHHMRAKMPNTKMVYVYLDLRKLRHRYCSGYGSILNEIRTKSHLNLIYIIYMLILYISLYIIHTNTC